MPVDNLPAVRTTRAVAVHQPAKPAPVKPAPTLPLSTALFVVTAVLDGLAGLSVFVDRVGQAQILAGVALLMLFAAFVELRRERRP